MTNNVEVKEVSLAGQICEYVKLFVASCIVFLLVAGMFLILLITFLIPIIIINYLKHKFIYI